MKVTIEPLFDKKQTAERIQYLIENYFSDLFNILHCGVPLPLLNIVMFFNIVRSIPYRRDISPKEVIARPGLIFELRKIGMDCKKKSVLCGSYARSNLIPFRAVGTSKRPDGRIHHIYIEVKNGREYKPMDATYEHFKLFEPKKNLTNKEVFFYG